MATMTMTHFHHHHRVHRVLDLVDTGKSVAFLWKVFLFLFVNDLRFDLNELIDNHFRPAFFAHRLKKIDDRTPLLKGSNTVRPKCIDVRVFSLGVLFIGGITVGAYMLHQQGA